MARYRMTQGVSALQWSWVPGHEFDSAPPGESIKRWLAAGYCEEIGPRTAPTVIETAESTAAPERAARTRKPRARTKK